MLIFYRYWKVDLSLLLGDETSSETGAGMKSMSDSSSSTAAEARPSGAGAAAGGAGSAAGGGSGAVDAAEGWGAGDLLRPGLETGLPQGRRQTPFIGHSLAR